MCGGPSTTKGIRLETHYLPSLPQPTFPPRQQNFALCTPPTDPTPQSKQARNTNHQPNRTPAFSPISKLPNNHCPHSQWLGVCGLFSAEHPPRTHTEIVHFAKSVPLQRLPVELPKPGPAADRQENKIPPPPPLSHSKPHTPHTWGCLFFVGSLGSDVGSGCAGRTKKGPSRFWAPSGQRSGCG